ncbi:MAG TPA: nucleotidyltransferase domain-containing protein [Opitutaceae bacterium]|nr:nucleotidyltransferase domain-containing protein [Opitutaceae bacterium]
MVEFLNKTIESIRKCENIKVAVLFGSYARLLKGTGDTPDQYSDIDVQLLVTKPQYFKDSSWLASLFATEVISASYRSVFGGARKAVIMFDGGSIDAVILPYRLLYIAKLLHRAHAYRWSKKFQTRMENFSDLMRFDHVVIKGNADWEKFYKEAGTLGKRLKLNTPEILKMSAVVCEETHAILGRIERGELIAAQRLLHQEIVEVNIKLLHELRERSGLKTYHRGRRAECTLRPEELALISVNASCNRLELKTAAIAMLKANATLVRELTGTAPKWASSNFFTSLKHDM